MNGRQKRLVAAVDHVAQRRVERVQEAAAMFAETFGLQGYPHLTFRINVVASHPTGEGDNDMRLWVDKLRPDGTWQEQFVWNTPSDLLDEVCEPAWKP